MYLQCIIVTLVFGIATDDSHAFNKTAIKEQVVEMFYHAYYSYMNNAWPADELMPLSCQGRYRGVNSNRGDIDDVLGNFSLTLIDTLDTLVIIGDYVEFERAVGLVIDHVQFDKDVDVSVFEVNIRVVGGLLSAHVLALEVQSKVSGSLVWYTDQLLEMARDIGIRLLPAFNTTTGLPHPRVNLRHGLTTWLRAQQDTCTACAGTMIMEFAALSRLTGDPIFERKAKKAMDFLWAQRHQGSDLMGSILNIENGDWVRRDSGVGAGIDSYYEYCLKAFILLGEEDYLDRFNKHYAGIMRYVNQGPMMYDVHMHRPEVTSRDFVDALLAFWPGLQVLKGDLKSAIEIHEMLSHVVKRHRFLPEAFTHDFQIYWSEHHLRPEFVESTYLLYKATNDPHYLEIGESIQKSLNKYARVGCGFAAVKDVRTLTHDDRLDSFVLAETFKYLYLLFADEKDLLIDLSKFVFTTEAHLLPLDLTGTKPRDFKAPPMQLTVSDLDESFSTVSCPHERRNRLIAIARDLRQNVQTTIQSSKKLKKRRKLSADEFNAGNPKHVDIITRMGIRVVNMPDGRVQLVQTVSNAASPEYAQEGLLFLKEMIMFHSNRPAGVMPHESARSIQILSGPFFGRFMLPAFPAQFGMSLTGNEIVGSLVEAEPLRACTPLQNSDELQGRIVIVERSECMFIEKAKRVAGAGAIAMIVIDHFPGTSSEGSPGFAMSGDGQTDVTIPAVFLFRNEGLRLRRELRFNTHLILHLSDSSFNPSSLLPTFLQCFGLFSPEFNFLRPSDSLSLVSPIGSEYIFKTSHSPMLSAQPWTPYCRTFLGHSTEVPSCPWSYSPEEEGSDPDDDLTTMYDADDDEECGEKAIEITFGSTYDAQTTTAEEHVRNIPANDGDIILESP